MAPLNLGLTVVAIDLGKVVRLSLLFRLILRKALYVGLMQDEKLCI